MRLVRAMKAFWGALVGRDQAPAQPALPAPASLPPVAKAPETDGLALLAYLQREARLVDFLMEPIEGYTDEQIGAAVRAVHRDAAAALRRAFEIAPVMEGPEGRRVSVAAGFDPSAIQLAGRVSGAPPFAGTLKHPGWRVARVANPVVCPTGHDRMVLAPAEVDVA